MRLIFFITFLVFSINAYSEIIPGDLTKHFEGFRAVPYVDTVGVKTIGYGFNMKDCGLENVRYMPRHTAEKIFNQKFRHAQEVAKRFAGDSWDGLALPAKVCLTDMAYNLGEMRLSKFKTLKKSIQDYDYKAMAISIKKSKYAKQTKSRAKYHIAKIKEI